MHLLIHTDNAIDTHLQASLESCCIYCQQTDAQHSYIEQCTVYI